MKFYKILIITVFLISIVLFFYSKNQPNNKIVRYLGNYGYCVGKIENYFDRGLIGHNLGRSSITYSYQVNNRKVISNYDVLFYRLPESPEKENKYIVLYNVETPENSIILGDYEIKNDTDFNKYVEELKRNPPNFK